jgi:hypothetical protein
VWLTANRFGFMETAFGFTATAFGFNATAFGFNATAFGFNATAFGFRATAFGFKATRGIAALRAIIVLLEATLLPSGLVTMAFLLAMRLLIRDFFSIDIACSWFFLIASYALYISNTRAKVAGSL